MVSAAVQWPVSAPSGDHHAAGAGDRVADELVVELADRVRAAGQGSRPGGPVGEHLLSTEPVCVIVHQGTSHAQWCAHFLITCGMRMTIPRPVARNGAWLTSPGPRVQLQGRPA